MAVLKATKREEIGTRQVRRLREQGLIPAVIYGHGEGAVSVTLNEHEVELAIQHGERLLEIEFEGKMHNVLIKEVQWETYGQEVIHVDLARVDLDERVEVTIKIVLKGTPAGASEGGVLQLYYIARQACLCPPFLCAVKQVNTALWRPGSACTYSKFSKQPPEARGLKRLVKRNK